MAVIIDGNSLTIEQIRSVAYGGEKVELSPKAKERVKASRALIEKIVASGEAVYGVTTGIGEFAPMSLARPAGPALAYSAA